MMRSPDFSERESMIPLWAGLECTVNRIGSRFFNQCDRSGHSHRLDDLKLFASLGVKKIRYPFLWELAAPESPEQINWSWIDERASELQRLHLEPIAGFVHHGSGPLYTDLLDSEFPQKLAFFAQEFAQRFPWIKDFTPVNEPLTTARFSGLYGVWYPHQKSDKAFARALYNEVKAIILSMQAIRQITPDARLIQTEDMGRVQSTEVLSYQADFENHRRWLSFDLLIGKVGPDHVMYEYLLNSGISDDELKWLQDHSCSPDILGLNHYLLSNRFLDHRLEYYPEAFHGGNGRHSYADVGVVDTTAGKFPNPENVIQEVWDRYQLPMAVTEVHLYGPRESQIRWLNQIYQGCCQLKDRGVDIKAVTAWSLLGSYDWNSLCTQEQGFYESGIFDLRSPKPRPTALAKLIRNWTGQEGPQGDFKIPLIDEPGWWMDPSRAPFGPRVSPSAKSSSSLLSRPILITGANGTLAKAFVRICETRRIPYRTLNRSQLNISDLESVRKAVDEIKPWAVINSAGYVRVDLAENERETCFNENVKGPQNLAIHCADKGVPLVHFSSDLVFDGSRSEPYLESHPVGPLNTYGESKALSEKIVLDIHPKSLILRTSSFFGPWDQANFAYSVLKSISRGQKFYAARDVTVSPTYVPDLVEATLDLLIDGETGILHLTNDGYTTWADWAFKIAEGAGRKTEQIIASPSSDLKFQARRPLFSALGSERIKILPSFEKALERYFSEMEFSLDTLSTNEELRL